MIYSLIGVSQKPEDYIHLLDQYGDKDYVMLTDHQKVIIERDDEKGVRILKEVEMQIYLTSDKAALFKNDQVSSSYFEKVLEIDAYALNKKNSKYKKEKVKDFDTKETISETVFFDDTKVTSFEYEGLKKESIINLSYVVELTDPHLSFSSTFASGFPILNKSLTVEVEKGINIEYNYFNMVESDVIFSVEDGKKTTIYKWTKDNPEIIKTEPAGPNPRYFIPHVVSRITTYENKKGETVNVLRNVGDLYNWYNSLLTDVKCDNEEELRKVLGEIINDTDAEKEKVKKVFEWVQKNVKYIAIEDGLGGFIPRNPDLVMSRRYGDCKDMATLIVNMLDMIDIKSHQVWIGTRDIPYTYEEMPTPAVDNHMIAAYWDKETNEYIFLDATDSKVVFGYPTPFIQGKEALVNKGDSFEIVSVPVVPAINNKYVDSVKFKLSEGLILGEGKIKMSGFYSTDFKHHLNNVKTEEAKKSQVKSITAKGNNKYKLNEYRISTDDTTIQYNYSFELSDYVFRNENETYVNMNLDRLANFFDHYTEDRKNAVEERYASNTNYYFELEIPEGFKVDYIPEDLIIEGEDYKVALRYSMTENNTLLYSLELDLDYILLPAERVYEIYSMGKQLKNAYNESVVLKKVNQ
ncbi:MAG: transglutaminase-like domain-containing protein [Brumimicrobium sp.]|nr:transglutaminase-like domain-containing protein [Brumimicrobium sp.]